MLVLMNALSKLIQNIVMIINNVDIVWKKLRDFGIVVCSRLSHGKCKRYLGTDWFTGALPDSICYLVLVESIW